MKTFRFKIIAGLAVLIFIFSCYFYGQSPSRQQVSGVSEENQSAVSQLKLDFFDVGQGDSALIITPEGQDILVDGGPDNKVLEKLGRALPIYDKTIELMILSHPHADHLVGLIEVLKRYQVDKIIISGILCDTDAYGEFSRLIKEKNIPVEIIHQPQELFLEPSVELSFLAPLTDLAGQRMANLNNSSIVFKLIYVSSTALFMGDYENEENFASSSLVKADILKVGHHGSTNANSRDFLAQVNPQFAIISVGKDNSYGLPNYRTIYELKKLGAEVFRTDETGDIKFFSDGKNWQLVN